MNLMDRIQNKKLMLMLTKDNIELCDKLIAQSDKPEHIVHLKKKRSMYYQQLKRLALSQINQGV